MTNIPVLSQLEQYLSVTNKRATVIASNMANANTPGYSRQIVSLSSAALVENGSSVDAGVTYTGYTSVRDSVLNMAVNDKTSSQASLQVQSSLLTQVNSAYSSTTTGIGAGFSSLFSSLSALSTNPNDGSARQAVLTSANSVVNAFHQGAAALSSATSSANQQVTSAVAQINQLTAQIAALNGQLSQTQVSGQGGALQDQRDQLTTQLATLTGVASTQTETVPTLTTGNGSPLVIGNSASKLQVKTGPDGSAHVLDASGTDITAALTGGTLGGALATRDTTLPALANQLNTLAAQFTNALNAAQAAGTDANGNTGSALLKIPVGSTNAAAAMTVVMTDPNGIAASSDGSSGSSGNLANLLAVQTSALPSGDTPGNTYASLVYRVGSAGSEANANLSAATASLTQLTAQRNSQSGVSIDEESINLIRFQQGYQAAAKVITTLNACYSILMNIGTGN